MSLAEPPLDPEALRRALGDQLIGREIFVLPETTSTNDVIAQMSADHAEGLVVIAEKQTAGRGQYGRRWESVPGKGLWLSILLRPTIAVADSARLTTLLAETISRTIADDLALAPRIKPPNDIFLGERKVAGVLVEMRVGPDGHHFAVAGLGLNVNHATTDFPPELREIASSLFLALGRPVDRFAFTTALLRRLESEYRTFRAR